MKTIKGLTEKETIEVIEAYFDKRNKDKLICVHSCVYSSYLLNFNKLFFYNEVNEFFEYWFNNLIINSSKKKFIIYFGSTLSPFNNKKRKNFLRSILTELNK